jgi:branched-chain amino acid transport system permease protein
MATMAFNLIVQRLLVNWSDLTGGPDGLPGIPPAAIGPIVFDRRTHFYLVAAAAIAVYWLSANLIRSRHGRTLLAIREDVLAASASGIAVHRAKLGVFALSAAFAGLAGSLFAHLYRHVSPASFGLDASIELLLAVLLGGPGSLGWPLVGTAIVTILPQLPALQALQDYRLLVYGGLLLASVVLFRGGLAGLAAMVRRPPLPPESTERPAMPGVSFALAGVGPGTASEPSLQLGGIRKTFGGVVALDDLSLTVEAGSVLGLIGPNGSGKTTALNITSGLVRADAGVIRLAGRDVRRWPAHRRAEAGLARTFQTARLFGQLTALDNILIGQHRWHRPLLLASMLHLPAERAEERAATRAAGELAAALGLGPHLDRCVDDLPPGIRRRVELARALALRPRVLLLDEPAAGLGADDLEELAAIIRGIRAEGVAVLLVEHHVELVLAVCDRLAVLDQGRLIADGPPPTVVADERVRAAYLGAAPRSGSG